VARPQGHGVEYVSKSACKSQQSARLLRSEACRGRTTTAPSKRSAVPNVPQPCHIVRSTTVNDGPPQSRCAVLLGCRYSRNDLGNSTADHARPYKVAVEGVPVQSGRQPSQHGQLFPRRGRGIGRQARIGGAVASRRPGGRCGGAGPRAVQRTLIVCWLRP
jgi:hypothetical protein